MSKCCKTLQLISGCRLGLGQGQVFFCTSVCHAFKVVSQCYLAFYICCIILCAVLNKNISYFNSNGGDITIACTFDHHNKYVHNLKCTCSRLLLELTQWGRLKQQHPSDIKLHSLGINCRFTNSLVKWQDKYRNNIQHTPCQ